ncbi:SelT/SelW/SelH family protein [Sessilibacter corallicola]|nr:SelT/SelW/SelH family protein [Sessilibacter corallicola]MCE2028214.1 SelT/SelW/SelH family protein [Sessilibacter corallicola]
MSHRCSVKIVYCTGCRWMLRSAWLAQELLTTFESQLEGVTLSPGTGGVFEITVDDHLIWERKRDGGFPDIKVLKQKVRDIIDPDMSLGHSDKPVA